MTNNRLVYAQAVLGEDRSDDLAEHIVTWLTDETRYQSVEQSLAELKDRVGQGGAGIPMGPGLAAGRR